MSAPYGPIYIGQGPPSVITATMASAGNFNPALATAAVLEWMAPDGVTVGIWACTFTAQTTASVTFQYALTGNEFTSLGRGTYRVWALVTLPTGTVRTEVESIVVKGQFDQ